MKVILVSPLPPPVGGIATWTEGYKQYCDKNEISLFIVNNALQGFRVSQESSKRSLIDEMRRSRKIFRDLIQKIKKEKPDVVHLNTSCSRFGIFRDCICALLSRVCHLPVILQCHCNIEDQIHGTMAKHAFRLMTSMCSKVLVLNRFSAAFAKKYAGEKVLIIPNFADENSVFERCGFNDKIQRALYVGHVRVEKGAREIIKAAAMLPNVHFTLIGPVQQDIEEKARTSNVEMPGAMSHDKVLKQLKEADVFLFPSYTEGFSNALLEAMACELPIIATDVGANAEMLENKGGIIIPTADADSLKNAIIELADVSARTQMGKWNGAKVRNEYMIDMVAKRIIRIYREVTA